MNNKPAGQLEAPIGRNHLYDLRCTEMKESQTNRRIMLSRKAIRDCVIARAMTKGKPHNTGGCADAITFMIHLICGVANSIELFNRELRETILLYKHK